MKYNALALTCLLYSVSLSVVATESYCSEQEQTVFSCSLGKKIVSVCASKDISPTSGYLQYRFGKQNAPELIFPALTNAPSQRSGIQARSLMFSGGGGAYLRFINGNYNYIVYTAIGKGWGTKDGVSVEKDGKLIANLKCSDVPVSILGEDFFSRAGLSADQDEFMLPE
ncbi:MAG: hypothetical protein EPN17_09910 [Methylobacter sp.]|nr:MAG: hypothetical protein EPN17_09910 [Methylobacter sp.]